MDEILINFSWNLSSDGKETVFSYFLIMKLLGRFDEIFFSEFTYIAFQIYTTLEVYNLCTYYIKMQIFRSHFKNVWN